MGLYQEKLNNKGGFPEVVLAIETETKDFLIHCDDGSGDGCTEHFIFKDINKFFEFKDKMKTFIEQFDFHDDDCWLGQFFEKYFDEYLELADDSLGCERSAKEINDKLAEVHERMWLMAMSDHQQNILESDLSDDELDDLNARISELCEKYDVNFSEPVEDKDFWYWAGMLDTLLWVLGGEPDC